MEPNHCKTHKDKALDYYCNNCSKSICMDCLMVGGEKSCKNHNVVSMQEVVSIFILQVNYKTWKDRPKLTLNLIFIAECKLL